MNAGNVLRKRFAEIHQIAEEHVYNSWEKAFEQGKIADVMIICTLDRMHYIPAMKALELGYHALKEGPFGRCVYRCDNNVVDHQVVNMEFASGANANFIMSGLTKSGTRRVQIMGTQGEIIGDMDKGSFTLYRYATGEEIEIKCSVQGDGHGGGDERMVSSFLKNVHQFDRNPNQGLTSATASLQSHLIAFASERSRLQQGRSIKLTEMYEKEEAGV